jgi:hypothetical protein
MRKECWCVAKDAWGEVLVVGGKFETYKAFYAWFDVAYFGYVVVEDGNGFRSGDEGDE